MVSHIAVITVKQYESYQSPSKPTSMSRNVSFDKMCDIENSVCVWVGFMFHMEQNREKRMSENTKVCGSTVASFTL